MSRASSFRHEKGADPTHALHHPMFEPNRRTDGLKAPGSLTDAEVAEILVEAFMLCQTSAGKRGANVKVPTSDQPVTFQRPRSSKISAIGTRAPLCYKSDARTHFHFTQGESINQGFQLIWRHSLDSGIATGAHALKLSKDSAEKESVSTDAFSNPIRPYSRKVFVSGSTVLRQPLLALYISDRRDLTPTTIIQRTTRLTDAVATSTSRKVRLKKRGKV